MSSYQRYTAVLFDLDDTLTKTHEIKFAQHKAVAKKFYNIDLTDDDIRPHWGKPLPELIDILYRGSDTAKNRLAAVASMQHAFPKKTQDDSLVVIQALLDAHRTLGIITASIRELVIPDLVRLGFPVDQFSFIQTADDTSVHKPNPAVFTTALERLATQNISPEQVVYIGDGLIDYTAASGAGIHFIGVTTGLTTIETFQEAGVKHTVTCLTEALPLILR